MRIQIRPTLLINNKGSKRLDSIDLVWLSELLQDIKRESTLMGAAKRAGTSYRTLWNKLNEIESVLNEKLVERIKGHGSTVSHFGLFLIQFVDQMQNRYSEYSENYQTTLSQEMAAYRLKQGKKWLLFSSSDPIIQQTIAKFSSFELRVAGSGESLERLLNHEADIAGYHVSDPENSRIIHQRLIKAGMQVVPVMKRIQGLIVQKGNPLNLTSISDLTNPKVRFINRQRGSGTRLLLDSLLAEKGLNPEKIKGYNNEEFTHSAVASTILANKANVGISVKNIALENKLGFIYLKDELFFLAMRKELAANKEVSKLISKIRNYAGITEGYKSLSAKVQLHDWI